MITKKMGIALFSYNQESETRNKFGLRDFVNFLLGQGVPRPLSFAHIEADGNLMSTLTLRENIELELATRSPRSRGKNGDVPFDLKGYVEKSGNIHLVKLFKKIPNLDELPSDVDKQTGKLVALVRGLVRKADYLFIDMPERHLSEANTKLFAAALDYRCSTLGTTALVCNSKESLWVPYSKKIIYMDKNRKVRVSDIKSQRFQQRPLTLVVPSAQKSRAA